jgi:hypothetical protein
VFRPRLLLVVVLVFVTGLELKGQQNPSSAEVERRVEALLGKLTLEEKITLIGGINDFYTRAIPRLGIPSLRMSDGPTGVRTITGPPQPIQPRFFLPLPGTRTLPVVLVFQWARTRVPVVWTSFWLPA